MSLARNLLDMCESIQETEYGDLTKMTLNGLHHAAKAAKARGDSSRYTEAMRLIAWKKKQDEHPSGIVKWAQDPKKAGYGYARERIPVIKKRMQSLHSADKKWSPERGLQLTRKQYRRNTQWADELTRGAPRGRMDTDSINQWLQETSALAETGEFSKEDIKHLHGLAVERTEAGSRQRMTILRGLENIAKQV